MAEEAWAGAGAGQRPRPATVILGGGGERLPAPQGGSVSERVDAHRTPSPHHPLTKPRSGA